jgi:hypothetical protein
MRRASLPWSASTISPSTVATPRPSRSASWRASTTETEVGGARDLACHLRGTRQPGGFEDAAGSLDHEEERRPLEHPHVSVRGSLLLSGSRHRGRAGRRGLHRKGSRRRNALVAELGPFVRSCRFSSMRCRLSSRVAVRDGEATLASSARGGSGRGWACNRRRRAHRRIRPLTAPRGVALRRQLEPSSGRLAARAASSSCRSSRRLPTAVSCWPTRACSARCCDGGLSPSASITPYILAGLARSLPRPPRLCAWPALG